MAVVPRAGRVPRLGHWAWGGGVLLVACLWVAPSFSVSRVLGDSMAPSLTNGDLLLGLRTAPARPGGGLLAPARPARGDIVVVRVPYGEGLAVKRVVAIGGDAVAMAAGLLLINGRPLDEPYAAGAGVRLAAAPPPGPWHFRAGVGLGRRDYRPTGADWGPVDIPSGHVFLLGDNRGQSEDSRSYGPVSLAAVHSVILARVW